MTQLEKRQRKNRFTFYMIVLVIMAGTMYWAGFNAGKNLERIKWQKEIEDDGVARGKKPTLIRIYR
jgi:hypothetical protein